ncbi:MAC/Perforin domain-containing protein [Hibiscus syriacus]|uniref:MAC/Perforin domain-containing protein n=1 Tax=Hibiscus syriacus TaxID=106335 RepID=A0A6A3AWT7_HIBSY|nr:MAC/Perforin domain-containing protein [Hibiscus syriacus]
MLEHVTYQFYVSINGAVLVRHNDFNQFTIVESILGKMSPPEVLDGLIDAYGKCTLLEDATRIFTVFDCRFGGFHIYDHDLFSVWSSIDDSEREFSNIPEKGIVSWSAMIGGLAQYGHGKEALQAFDRMLKSGVYPNQITLVSVLCACNHAGLVTEAKKYFRSMELFGFKPMQEHYACMIDILGRAGRFKEAMELVNSIPFQADGSVWGALLCAARIHKNVEIGLCAAAKLFTLEPEKSGTHVLLANIYASVGMWDNVAKMRKLMKDCNVKKEPEISSIEVKDKIHTFIAGDRSHFDIHDVDRGEKEKLLYHHSEKLAVAFGLITTPAGAPIRVKKNLRVCVD